MGWPVHQDWAGLVPWKVPPVGGHGKGMPEQSAASLPSLSDYCLGPGSSPEPSKVWLGTQSQTPMWLLTLSHKIAVAVLWGEKRRESPGMH